MNKEPMAARKKICISVNKATKDTALNTAMQSRDMMGIHAIFKQYFW
jgi:hypothetical protein